MEAEVGRILAVVYTALVYAAIAGMILLAIVQGWKYLKP
jgi:hypothetical protein